MSIDVYLGQILLTTSSKNKNLNHLCDWNELAQLRANLPTSPPRQAPLMSTSMPAIVSPDDIQRLLPAPPT